MEPRALDSLTRMSEALGVAKAFTYRSRRAVEFPARTAQCATLVGTLEVARPTATETITAS